ncbi:MAG: cell division protein [Bacteroidaceae bacterium]|nr:cell division protein [Bacteroidaceae bacterium]
MAEEEKKKKGQSVLKSVVKLLAMLVLLAYIVFAFVKEKNWANRTPCEQFVVCIQDSAQASFVSEDDVMKIIQNKHLNPVGRPLDKVQLIELEKAAQTHQFVLNAKCYKMADNTVHLDIEQRLPVMRIFSTNGDNYYIDAKGEKMPKVTYPADVVVATGNITPRYAAQNLAPLGRFLMKEPFWNSQIEQFHVLKDGSVEMIPRVGNHVVYFGQPIEMEAKLGKLHIFYDKVLCRIGWNKYRGINMEYANQIVCTKTE